MAGYPSPTVIQPVIPLIDVSPLERLLLCHMMQFEDEGEELYLFAELSIDLMPAVSLAQLRAAYMQSGDFESRIMPYVRDILDISHDDDDAADIELNLTARHNGAPFESILQDIIRRSSTLTYLSLTTAYVCSKMRPDGFGGRATLVTEAFVRSQSTDDLMESFIYEAKLSLPDIQF